MLAKEKKTGAINGLWKQYRLLCAESHNLDVRKRRCKEQLQRAFGRKRFVEVDGGTLEKRFVERVVPAQSARLDKFVRFLFEKGQ